MNFSKNQKVISECASTTDLTFEVGSIQDGHHSRRKASGSSTGVVVVDLQHTDQAPTRCVSFRNTVRHVCFKV